MKNKITSMFVVVLVLALLLTSCSSQTATATSWGGVTITDTAMFYADGAMVYALKVENGNTIWSYPEKASATRIFLAAPVVVDEQVIFGDYANLLTSLSTRDGAENWQFAEATSKYIDSPLVVGDMLVAPNADHNLYALDLSGNLLWTFAGEHSFWATPVSDGEVVFAPNLDHYLYAVDLGTGEQVWKTDLKASLVGRATLADGIIYLGNLDGNVFAVDSADGSILWEQKVSGGVWSAPTLVDGQLFFGDQAGNINILNVDDGSIAQTVSIESPVLGAGAVLEDGIIYGDEKGELVLIGFDGAKKWTRSVGGSIYSNLAIYGDTLAVIANKGEKPLVAFDIEGNEIWYFTTK